MKGQIKKTDYGWIVVWSHPMEYREPIHELPLHPKDIELFNQFEKIFDNFEARVLASPEVDFEISWWADGAVPKQYAKLKNNMLDIKQQKTQSSIEYFHDAVNDMIARRRPINSNEVAKILIEAEKIHEQEIIDTWVASAQYGMTGDSKIDSDEPKIAKVYYDNKYRK